MNFLHPIFLAAITLTLVSGPVSAADKDSEIAAALDKIVTHQARRLGVPGGAFGVISNGKVVLRKVDGTRRLSGKETINTQTMFQIGSIAKTFTAAIAVKFAEVGKLRLSDPISSFLPQRCAKNQCDGITVSHLLNHTSGIPAAGVNDRIESGVAYDEVVAKALAAKRTCAPGKCFEYNNAAYELVREILEATDKRPYSEILSAQLLVPLKMNQTSTTFEGLKRADNFFTPHLFQSGRFVETAFSTAYYALPGSSVLNSNLDDMLKLVAAELGDSPEILSPAALKLLHTATTEAPDANAWIDSRAGMQSKYALGHRILQYPGLTIVFHPGWIKGCKSLVAFVPERRLGLVLLQNSGSQLGFRVLEDVAQFLRKGAAK